MAARRINVTLPEDVLALLDAHTASAKIGRSAYITGVLRRMLVADSLAAIAAHNGGRLPYAGELDGAERQGTA
jgi:hypothetical protein